MPNDQRERERGVRLRISGPGKRRCSAPIGIGRIWVLCLGLWLVPSCYARHTRQEYKDDITGQDISYVISSMGVPTRVYELPNGNKLYEWNRYDAFNNACDIRLTVNGDNRVVETHFGGTGCF